MHRIFGAVFAIAVLLAFALMCANVNPAAGDGVAPTFVPELTPAPSPTVAPTERPSPLSRPEDARGISQTMPPPRSPSPYTPPAIPPALWLATAASSVIPCSLHGNRLFLPVVVNGRPETFLLDSAAQYTMIDPASAPSRDAPVKLSTVQIGAVRFNGLVAGVSRITSSTRSALGAAADGVLGQELFSRFPVLIDYAGCSVTIFRDGASAQAALASDTHQAPLHMLRGFPALDATFDGDAAARLVVDTASDGDVDVTRDFADGHMVTFVQTSSQARRWLPSGSLSGERAHVRTITVGSLAFDRPSIGIFPIRVLPGGAAGYVGNGLLQHYAVLLDEPDSIAAFAAGKSP